MLLNGALLEGTGNSVTATQVLRQRENGLGYTR